MFRLSKSTTKMFKKALHVLLIGAPCVLFPGSALAMTASHKVAANGATVLVLSGRIQSGDFAALKTKLNARNFREVWLDSPGGHVATGYELGREIRRLKLVTRVPAGSSCGSACVDVFIGGLIRFTDPDGNVMVHPGSDSVKGEQIMEDLVKGGKTAQGIQLFERNATVEAATWTRYLTMMGVSLDLVNFAAQVSHECGILMRREELIYFNVVNTAGAPPSGYRPASPQKVC